MEQGEKPVLFFFSLFVSAVIFIVVGAGGLVTSFGAGLSVPDWPLSFGQFFPPMHGLMVFEHGHRMVAGAAGVLVLMLALTLTFSGRGRLSLWVWAVFGLVVVQALLGGATVLLGLPPAVSISHALTGQMIFALMTGVTFYLSPYRRRVYDPVRDKRLFYFAAAIVTLTFIQITAGAVVRHTNTGSDEHIGIAFVFNLLVYAAVLDTLRHHACDRHLRLIVQMLGFLLIVQIFLGIGAFAMKALFQTRPSLEDWKVMFTAVHQTFGAVFLGAAVWFLMRVRVSRETAGNLMQHDAKTGE